MADAIVSRLGQANGTGATDALFIKKFTGEVLTSFEQASQTLNRHQVRTITEGKSASFAVMGRAQAMYHTPGSEILGGQIKHNEVIITIDQMLIAPTFIANIDEAMNHYDVRSQYTKESGNVLAWTKDRQVLTMGVKAARSNRNIDEDEQFGGSTIYNVDPTDGDSIADAMFEAARIFDEKNVPEDERTLYLPPAAFYALAKSTKLQNRDWGGTGSIAEGTVIKVAGITIVKTNNVPSSVIASGSTLAGTGDKYAGDFSSTVGVLMHPSAVGTVKLLDLSVESEYQISRQGTLMVAKYAMGHGVLRPEAAIELSSAIG